MTRYQRGYWSGAFITAVVGWLHYDASLLPVTVLVCFLIAMAIDAVMGR